MIKASKRYQSFLNNYEFYPNSIQFRINSSKSLEKFKNVQSFQLNQVLNGKYHFNQDRREILLLKYDMWSRWLVEIENLMIELSGNHLEFTLKEKDIEMIISLAVKTSDTYKDVINNKHKENFDQEFSKLWMEIHELSFTYMIEEIKLLTLSSYGTAFTKIVDILTEVMQNTLYEIYELDSIISNNSNSIFLIVTNMSYKCFDSIGVCSIENRINIYKKYFKFDEIYFKNYTDHKLRPNIIDGLEKDGIEINYKKSIASY